MSEIRREELQNEVAVEKTKDEKLQEIALSIPGGMYFEESGVKILNEKQFLNLIK